MVQKWNTKSNGSRRVYVISIFLPLKKGLPLIPGDAYQGRSIDLLSLFCLDEK
jgi:hypothetical protein